MNEENYFVNEFFESNTKDMIFLNDLYLCVKMVDGNFLKDFKEKKEPATWNNLIHKLYGRLFKEIIEMIENEELNNLEKKYWEKQKYSYLCSYENKRILTNTFLDNLDKRLFARFQNYEDMKEQIVELFKRKSTQ